STNRKLNDDSDLGVTRKAISDCRNAFPSRRRSSGRLGDLHLDLKQLGSAVAGAGGNRVETVRSVEDQLADAETILLVPRLYSVHDDKCPARTLREMSDPPAIGAEC